MPPSVFYILRDAGLIYTYVAMQRYIVACLAGLLIHSHNLPGISRVFTAHNNTHTHPTLLPHRYSYAERRLDLFWKAGCTFKSSCELKLCPSFTLICHFSFVQTSRPAYLNNTLAPLDCKTNTVHIFAGLSAFSCFIGILQCTFFSLK